jgi:hypothetical protein
VLERELVRSVVVLLITVGGKLLKEYPELFKLSSSHTTRQPRSGEEHGVHYWFVTREEFEKGLEEGKFIGNRGSYLALRHRAQRVQPQSLRD